jgi:CRISPR-associated protein (TIGR03986 family)
VPEFFRSQECTATKQGDVLTAVASHSISPKAKPKPQRYPRRLWDEDLAAWFDSAADDDQVAVIVNVTITSEGYLSMRDKPVIAPATTPPGVREALDASGGFVNPYTFVPTPPRTELLNGPRDHGLGDSGEAGPPSQALISTGEWTGTIHARLTTLTPLLLPDTANSRGRDDGPLTFSTLLDTDGLPLIQGSSFKGALRSAYETITASRFGVFGRHDRRLAYRIPAVDGAERVPAIIELDADGQRVFRLCRGDRSWTLHGGNGNLVQAAAWVPAYQSQGRHLTLVGDLNGVGDLNDALKRLHGRQVAARLRLYQYEHPRRPGRFLIWRVTHLAANLQALRAALPSPSAPLPQEQTAPSRSLRLVEGVGPRTDTGVLSITGKSIDTKHDERFFVLTDDDERPPVKKEHDEFWRSVLDAYSEAKEYNTVPGNLSRSRHVDQASSLRDLPVGTLVYVVIDGEERLDDGRHQPIVAEVHPVMIGRRPFDQTPGTRLDPSLRPASSPDQLSPADRLFGWAPLRTGTEADASPRGTSSGYRGRLAVRAVTCSDRDWKQDLPGEGVILAPLSSPKPTQFRFYAAEDDSGTPVRPKTEKKDGYTETSGLRGRKIYRWPAVPDTYWQPSSPTQDFATVTDAAGMTRYREYLNPEASPSQTVRYRDWVRPDTTFTAELFLDGVPTAELGALLWLLDQGTKSPLRLGPGKPHGFGVLACTIDWTATTLRDNRAMVDGWRSLVRPAPAEPSTLTALATAFEQHATRHPVLAEALASYRAATAAVDNAPVHYPRSESRPTKESYKWFVDNDKSTRHGIPHGWSLPHIRDEEQRLPYLDGGREPRPQVGPTPTRSKQQRKPRRLK